LVHVVLSKFVVQN